MKVFLKGTSPNNYICSNERGEELILSGDKTNVGPMESVLMAAASCSSIDIELILGKMRQDLKSIKAEVEGTRAETMPKVYTHIKLHYILTGNLKEEKVKQAIEMSVTEYCSVLCMLAKTATIGTSFEIIK
jgi:putative redox protein